MASVFARRCRRGAATDPGSTTRLSTPWASSSRCTQKPSMPASWTTTTPTGPPADRSTLPRRRVSRASSAAPSPAATECFDILPPPGASDVTSQADRLSSRDAYSVAWWCRSWGGSCSGHGLVGCIGSSLRCCRRSPHRTKAGRDRRPMESVGTLAEKCPGSRHDGARRSGGPGRLSLGEGLVGQERRRPVGFHPFFVSLRPLLGRVQKTPGELAWLGPAFMRVLGRPCIGTEIKCLLNPSGVLPGVGRPMARAPATEPPTSGHFLLGRRVQLASAALEKLAVCKGPAAAKPSARAPTRDLCSALTA